MLLVTFWWIITESSSAPRKHHFSLFSTFSAFWCHLSRGCPGFSWNSHRVVKNIPLFRDSSGIVNFRSPRWGYRTGIFRNSKNVQDRLVTFCTFYHFLEVDASLWRGSFHSHSFRVDAIAWVHFATSVSGSRKDPPRKTPLGPGRTCQNYVNSSINRPEWPLNGMSFSRF